MKLLKALTICLVLPFAFVACDKKEDSNEASNDGGADKKADTHEIIAKEYFGFMEQAMGAMASIDSKEAAEAFVASAKEIHPKLEAILERAKALPAPTDEQKSALQATHKEIEERMMKKLMAAAEDKKEQSAEDSAAIQEEMMKVMSGEFGKKMDAITDEVDAFYGFGD